MNNLQATAEQDIRARIAELQAKRDSIKLDDPALEPLRDRSVALKNTIKRLKAENGPEKLDELNKAQAELDKITEERRKRAQEYRVARSAVKREIRELEEELQRREREKEAAGLREQSDDELEKLSATLTAQKREIHRKLKAVWSVLDERAAAKRARDLIAGLSEEERKALLHEVLKEVHPESA